MRPVGEVLLKSRSSKVFGLRPTCPYIASQRVAGQIGGSMKATS